VVVSSRKGWYRVASIAGDHVALQVKRDEREEVEEEGTPEYIRRHFFPNEPPNPALDWMKPPLETGTGAETVVVAAAGRDLGVGVCRGASAVG
jgi:hypothetical protein